MQQIYLEVCDVVHFHTGRTLETGLTSARTKRRILSSLKSINL